MSRPFARSLAAIVATVGLAACPTAGLAFADPLGDAETTTVPAPPPVTTIPLPDTPQDADIPTVIPEAPPETLPDPGPPASPPPLDDVPTSQAPAPQSPPAPQPPTTVVPPTPPTTIVVPTQEEVPPAPEPEPAPPPVSEEPPAHQETDDPASPPDTVDATVPTSEQDAPDAPALPEVPALPGEKAVLPGDDGRALQEVANPQVDPVTDEQMNELVAAARGHQQPGDHDHDGSGPPDHEGNRPHDGRDDHGHDRDHDGDHHGDHHGIPPHWDGVHYDRDGLPWLDNRSSVAVDVRYFDGHTWVNVHVGAYQSAPIRSCASGVNGFSVLVNTPTTGVSVSGGTFYNGGSCGQHGDWRPPRHDHQLPPRPPLRPVTLFRVDVKVFISNVNIIDADYTDKPEPTHVYINGVTETWGRWDGQPGKRYFIPERYVLVPGAPVTNGIPPVDVPGGIDSVQTDQISPANWWSDERFGWGLLAVGATLVLASVGGAAWWRGSRQKP